MRHSIRFKMTFLLTVMVAAIILLTWLINNLFLSEYYVHNKKINLVHAYYDIAAIYDGSADGVNLSEQETASMEHIALNYGIDIYVINLDRFSLYISFPSAESISPREEIKISEMVKVYNGFLVSGIENVKKIKSSKDYDIYSLYDRLGDANYIDMVGYYHNTYQTPLGNGGTTETNVNNIFLIRTNVENIEESVAISNSFLAYIGAAVVILGIVIMFFISRKFTKPIHDLAGIAKKMSDLDFNAKYEVKTKDEIGELGSCINSLSDKLEKTISELKQANNELLNDIQKKTEIDEMRKEFLSNVSHELKTPISLIQGYAEGLKENIAEDEESRNFYCEVIMDEANKMNQMVKKLLSLNELEFGNNQVDFERFDITSLIRSILASTEILFRQKGVTLIFDQQVPVYVWADEFLIEQVLTNYISNALNHVSGQRIIEIKLIPHDDTVRVAVFNTGENIPEDELDKIWEKFYKVDKARTRDYGGSGIGLSIVKAIMNSHNRECGVINRPVGVEFWFELDAKS